MVNELINWIASISETKHFTSTEKLEIIEELLLNYYKQQNEGKWTTK